MRNAMLATTLIGAFATSAFYGAAQAGEANITGFFPAVPNNATVVEKADGSSVVMFDVKGFLIVDDQSNPWHGALMDCNGIGAYGADGSIQTEVGTCMIIDRDGDVQSLPWVKTTATGGTWKIAGGSGKLAGMTGSGTYTDVPVADGRLFNTWTFTQITP